MTSLDFQSLLKKEKALQRAKLCAENAAQLLEQSGLGTSIRTHDQNTSTVVRRDDCKRTSAGGTRDVGDGLKNLAVPAMEDADGAQSMVISPSCFAQLAARPSLDMRKAGVNNSAGRRYRNYDNSFTILDHMAVR